MTTEIHEQHNQHITIIINGNPYHVQKETMTGKEIKQLAGGPLDYLLVQIVGSPDPAAGGDDKIIGDNDTVHLKSGIRFRIVNPATFG